MGWHPGAWRVRARHSLGVTLAEVCVASAIGLIVFVGLMELLRSGWNLHTGIGTHLGLAADARRAFVVLVRELHEGMSLVRPLPGQTASFALIRDKVSRLVLYAAYPSPSGDTYALTRLLVTPSGSRREILLTGVSRMTFTALSDRSVLVHLTLGVGERHLALHTQVRLRNRDAAVPF